MKWVFLLNSEQQTCISVEKQNSEQQSGELDITVTIALHWFFFHVNPFISDWSLFEEWEFML